MHNNPRKISPSSSIKIEKERCTMSRTHLIRRIWILRAAASCNIRGRSLRGRAVFNHNGWDVLESFHNGCHGWPSKWNAINTPHCNFKRPIQGNFWELNPQQGVWQCSTPACLPGQRDCLQTHPDKFAQITQNKSCSVMTKYEHNKEDVVMCKCVDMLLPMKQGHSILNLDVCLLFSPL